MIFIPSDRGSCAISKSHSKKYNVKPAWLRNISVAYWQCRIALKQVAPTELKFLLS